MAVFVFLVNFVEHLLIKWLKTAFREHLISAKGALVGPEAKVENH